MGTNNPSLTNLPKQQPMYNFFKRLFDVFFSLTGIVLLSPLFIIIIILIKYYSPGPIFYRGVRAAKGGDTFRIYKFRTMVVNAEKSGGFSTAIDDPRFTRVGRILRKYKIDELPQFINVFIGDMSLVGPRPQVTYYTDQYKGEEKLILTVKPGMTDLASIYFIDMDSTLGSGDVDKKYQMEIEPVKNKLRIRYVKKASFILDMRILIETFFRILGVHNITGLDFGLKQ